MTKIRILHIPTNEFCYIDKEEIEKSLKQNQDIDFLYCCRMKACGAKNEISCELCDCYTCPWDRFSGITRYDIEYDIQEIE